MVMGKVVDGWKERLWRKRLARFAGSGQTVAGFCLAERVSVPTFYQWKRKLASRSVRTAGGKPDAARSADRVEPFLPVRIEGTARVEIELPNGTRVRIPASDLGAVEVAIAAAGRVAARGPTERPRC
jgi:hypothetical protein